MSKDKIIKKLKAELPALKKEYPIKTLGIFGSVARGDDTPKSDVDILVEFYENKPVGFFKFIDLEENLSALLDKKVDLVTKRALKPIIKQGILNDVIYV
ncbi:MAG: nucleotidyltransferase family protein [Candidatus Komeilibacteria bacterium]|nr:nucleotidyltransferase family protein [Candidatus Komeilibacteria bacterium]